MAINKTLLTDVCVVCATVAFSMLLRRRSRRNEVPLPPGPRRLPIVDNLFQVPTVKLWETAMEWGKTYGDMIYVEVAGMPMLMVNSHEVALDLLSKRSANYSSRPKLIMPELAGWGWVTSIIPYGDSLRNQRAIFHRFFQSPDILNYKELQERECRVFLRNMLETPGDYGKHVRRLPVAVLGMNAYGHEVKDDNDRYMELGEESALATNESLGYLHLDLLPWLQYLPEWFPGGAFKKFARESRKLAVLFRNEIYNLNKSKRLSGTAKESMTTIYLDEHTDANGRVENEDDFVDAVATVFFGGSDTSISVLMGLVVAILKYPDMQHQAQKEIDAFIGNERLPTFKDRDQLPYINAICLDWQPIVPLGMVHISNEADEYRGYHIPAGTMVFPNLWAMSRDEALYPDASHFKPERWLPGGSNFSSLRPTDFGFGYGRRICPGQVWAEHMIFIATASLLSAFNIESALDWKGEPIPPNDEYKPALVRFLGPSQCRITPRSEKIASLIRDSAEAL